MGGVPVDGMTWGRAIAIATCRAGFSSSPLGLTHGALVPVMTRYPPPSAGIYVIRPPGLHPARKVRMLTELLIECFEQAPHLADVGR
jgi:DNA-binding transcriptional LysR family regulator